MRRFSCVSIATAWLLAGSAASAQQAPGFMWQALLSTSTRTVTDEPAASTGGVQFMVRAGHLVQPNLGLVGEFSLASFADEALIRACPAGVPCLPAMNDIPGLGVAGFSVGVQPRLHAGPLELLLTATAGEYWLYHRRTDLPATSPGVRGALGIGIPIHSRLHILLEASASQMLRSGVGEANLRQIGLGVALN